MAVLSDHTLRLWARWLLEANTHMETVMNAAPADVETWDLLSKAQTRTNRVREYLLDLSCEDE